MKAIHMIAWVLLIIGGLNWGIYGVTGGKWEVGHLLGGMTSTVSMVVYILVGIAALYDLFTHKSHCKTCGNNSAPSQPTM